MSSSWEEHIWRLLRGDEDRTARVSGEAIEAIADVTASGSYSAATGWRVPEAGTSLPTRTIDGTTWLDVSELSYIEIDWHNGATSGDVRVTARKTRWTGGTETELNEVTGVGADTTADLLQGKRLDAINYLLVEATQNGTAEAGGKA